MRVRAAEIAGQRRAEHRAGESFGEQGVGCQQMDVARCTGVVGHCIPCCEAYLPLKACQSSRSVRIATLSCLYQMEDCPLLAARGTVVTIKHSGS